MRHTTRTKNAIASKQSQQGAVLFVALILVLVLSIMAVSSMQISTLEEHMAGSTQDHNRALQAAETALRDAETFIENLPSNAAFNGSKGLYGPANAAPDSSAYATWSGDASRPSTTKLETVSTQPRYFIQQMFDMSGNASNPTMNQSGYGGAKSGSNVTVFLITARGTGLNDNSQVVLREHYGRVL